MDMFEELNKMDIKILRTQIEGIKCTIEEDKLTLYQNVIFIIERFGIVKFSFYIYEDGTYEVKSDFFQVANIKEETKQNLIKQVLITLENGSKIKKFYKKIYFYIKKTVRLDENYKSYECKIDKGCLMAKFFKEEKSEYYLYCSIFKTPKKEDIHLGLTIISNIEQDVYIKFEGDIEKEYFNFFLNHKLVRLKKLLNGY